ncbi:MAG TPA: 1-acyl-sn-glycerol-3-phosphate acyltransferase [Chthoniobacteraceae bacterium]|jgi:1-acyl-sn-glycerol-3-phosphate acyltransferase|nr:1-acyl-sn-glycerol-3-phosphate acyltransferase [Chthoniobacteraceae bacterium]
MTARELQAPACAGRMKRLWYAGCHRLCARVYFERITVLHPERVSASGPNLYVGLHRNGAVDGFVYRQAVPRGVFLISTQLRRSFFGRLFFCGIAVARKSDEEDRGQNDEALRECMQLLASGGDLFVFPEGTSSLGPRHLPFKSGAARIALDALGRGVPLRVVPLGIHYERAWAFRSKVEVVVGEPIATEFPDGSSELARLKEMKRRITTALESVGTNFPSAEAQEDAQRIAYVATLGTPRSYFAALKALEAGVPEPLLAGWRDLTSRLAARRVLLHQGVPLFPIGPWMLYLVLLLGLGPLVLAGALVNAPPLFLGWLAARKFADDRNVIALWRNLVGLPLFVLWFGVVNLSLACFAGWAWVLGYVLLTVAALKSLYRAKKVGVSVWNGLVHRDLAPRAHAFHQSVLQALARS